MKEFKPYWKQLAKDKKITSTDVVQYHLLRAMTAKTPKNYEEIVNLAEIFLLSAFTPISNKNKLEKGGCKPFQSVGSAANHARLQYITSKYKQPNFQQFIETEEEIAKYKRLLEDSTKRLYTKLEEWYTYLFVRTDLAIPQMIVQTSHAVFKMRGEINTKELGIKNPEAVNFVLCGVDNLPDLLLLRDYLEKHKFTVSTFIEPDLDNEMTALVIPPVPYNKRGVCRTFPLLNFFWGASTNNNDLEMNLQRTNIDSRYIQPKPVFKKEDIKIA